MRGAWRHGVVLAARRVWPPASPSQPSCRGVTASTTCAGAEQEARRCARVHRPCLVRRLGARPRVSDAVPRGGRDLTCISPYISPISPLCLPCSSRRAARAPAHAHRCKHVPACACDEAPSRASACSLMERAAPCPWPSATPFASPAGRRLGGGSGAAHHRQGPDDRPDPDRAGHLAGRGRRAARRLRCRRRASPSEPQAGSHSLPLPPTQATKPLALSPQPQAQASPAPATAYLLLTCCLLAPTCPVHAA